MLLTAYMVSWGVLADVAEHMRHQGDKQQILLEQSHSSHIQLPTNVLEVTSTILQLHHTL